PQPVLEPKRGMQDRIILLRRADLEPDAAEAGERLQFGPRDVARLIIPDEIAVQRGLINDERDERQREPEPDGMRRGFRHAGERKPTKHTKHTKRKEAFRVFGVFRGLTILRSTPTFAPLNVLAAHGLRPLAHPPKPRRCCRHPWRRAAVDAVLRAA